MSRNINFALTEVEIGTLFASFGPVKSCHLVLNTDNTSPSAAAAAAAAARTAAAESTRGSAVKATDAAAAPHRGYGFVEFFTPQSADAAVASMQNFQLAGRLLRVSYAEPLNDPVKSAAAAANHAAAALSRNLLHASHHARRGGRPRGRPF